MTVKPSSRAPVPPIDTVAALEEAASFPHVTSALADLKGITLEFDGARRNTNDKGGVNSDVIALSQRFAILMSEYHQSIEDGVITVNEAKRLLLPGDMGERFKAIGFSRRLDRAVTGFGSQDLRSRL